jgi:HK97 family phage portal protein
MKMSKVKQIFQAFSNQRNPTSWLMEAFGGRPSRTGIKVTTESSLGLAPVMYAVNKISGHIAQLPLDVCQYEKDGSKTPVRNNVFRLLNKSPNQIMSPYQLKEIMMVHALITGNGRAYIERNTNGTPTALIPILPHNCQTMLVDGQKWHLVTQEAGTTQDAIPNKYASGEYYKIPDRDVLHVMNTSYNGVWGMHVIDIAKDVFGLTQAGQEGAAVTIANSGKPGMILEAPHGMFRNPEDAKDFLDGFNAAHEGLDNTGKAGLLRDGMTAKVLPVTGTDSQFLQQRNFQREEIALLFGLESIMGDNSGQTYKSISERNTAYINNCLGRWFAKWTEEIESKLMPYGGLEAEFNTKTLMQGDPNSLADYTLKLGQEGIATINERRYMHGLDPIEGGDVLPHEIAMQISEAAAPPSDENETEDTETETEPTETEGE